ncbi:hypothetical protein TNCV_4266751 [Trichonephila clavipes]|nr:hypothetical protein TNCV_4266751 [Trichonephila clavipes]
MIENWAANIESLKSSAVQELDPIQRNISYRQRRNGEHIRAPLQRFWPHKLDLAKDCKTITFGSLESCFSLDRVVAGVYVPSRIITSSETGWGTSLHPRDLDL